MVGELAALATAACWTISSFAFTAAGRRVGSLNVNLIRLALALVFLAGYGWLTRGQPWPSDAPAPTWGWLLLSGFIGFTLGDLCLFEAFVLLGTRLATLMMTLAPLLTAVIGWLVLGERLAGRDWTGILITVAGIWLVLAEKHAATEAPHDARQLRTGLWLGLGAAAGQAIGLVLSKQGMGRYDAFGATQIRVIAGLAGFAALFAAQRRYRQLGAVLRQPAAMGFIALGAWFGPFVGVGLALVAVQHIPTGIAATIIGLVPVFVIPPAVLLHGDRVGWRAMTGTVVAVAGVALLCL
jgi:drug/metabolite transporter (DMT)-like permease